MRLFVVSIVLTLSPVVAASEPPQPNPRSAIESYLEAALAGRFEDAAALALENKSAGRPKTLRTLRRLVTTPKLKVTTVLVGAKKGQSLAVSEHVKIAEANPDGRNTGYLVFLLFESQGKWLVDDIDFDTEAKMQKKVAEFRQQNPDAKPLPASPDPRPTPTSPTP